MTARTAGKRPLYEGGGGGDDEGSQFSMRFMFPALIAAPDKNISHAPSQERSSTGSIVM